MTREQYEYDDDSGEFVPNLVFVGMHFSDELKQTWETIQSACAELGLNAKQAKDSVGSQSIIDQIIRLIEDAEFLIFDLSYERPNVYYEIGYAHGIGNEPYEILLIADESATIHFNISQFTSRKYKNQEELRKIVQDNLRKMMEASRV